MRRWYMSVRRMCSSWISWGRARCKSFFFCIWDEIKNNNGLIGLWENQSVTSFERCRYSRGQVTRSVRRTDHCDPKNVPALPPRPCRFE